MLTSYKLGYGSAYSPYLSQYSSLLIAPAGTPWFKSSDDHSIDRAVVEGIKTALKLGYTHIDAAEVHNTKPEVGLAIKESKIPREKLFVTTKVIQTIAGVPKAIDTSLKKFQLDYVDLQELSGSLKAEEISYNVQIPGAYPIFC